MVGLPGLRAKAASQIQVHDRSSTQAVERVILTKVQVQMMLDSVMRGMRAAEQADRARQAAARGFRDEAESLRASCDVLLGFLGGVGSADR